MADSNPVERKRWNDEVWAALWPKREEMTTAVTPVLLDALALQPGENVVDIGCGGGLTSLAAARAVGDGGHVTGVDISDPITRLAQQRADDAKATNVTFTVADMQEGDTPGAPFDVAMSQFGVMFFDEPVKAFTNIGRHVKPGGRIAFACWRDLTENPWFFATVIAEYMTPPPPPAEGKQQTGPFTLADFEHTKGILDAAGFADVQRTPHDIEVSVEPNSIVDEVQLEFMGVQPGDLAAAMAKIRTAQDAFRQSDGRLRIPLRIQIVQARRP
jgi:SAM-dependent methyltransferase